VRRGERVLVVLENWGYRTSAGAEHPAHQRSVDESFAPSTVASLPVVAEAPAASWWTPPTSWCTTGSG
jgi:hypothetical protein